MTTDTPPPSAPAPAAPAKKANPIVRIGIGCLGVLVIGCIAVGALATYENWQQERNYQAGHTAYAAADCAGAVDMLRKAASGEPGTRDSDVARKAEAELQECEALIEADTLAQGGQSGDAALSYAAFVTKYENSPLSAQALAKGQELLANGAPEALASADLCQSIEDLESGNLITAPDQTIPPLLYACGQTFEDAGAYSDAVSVYDRFRQEYPNHPLANDVQLAFVRATIAEAEALGAGSLPPPQAIGEGGNAGEQVTVVIQNDSPEKLSMVFSGPETRVEELEPCTDCEKFSGEGPEACPELGPVGRYQLAPGDYTVVVKSGSGGDVTPFRGTWTLEGGQEYSSCFYIVSR